MSAIACRPVWWSTTHERALAALSRSKWTSLTDLLAQGFGTLVFCELELAGYAERRLQSVDYTQKVPTNHVLYRKASGL